VDLCAIPATGLARLIRSRELSAAELLTAVLARIDEVNPALNAIVTVSAHPAISVPAGLTASGLPVGLQLVGPYGGDLRLLEIAAAIMALAE
jgi:Asp-tRNA(Asn)/Glu-tRNA(Gln) amidotransferase A subunit family amidase